MTRRLALIIIVGFAVLLAVLVSVEHRTNGLAMPLLIESAAPACPKLANPCDEIDCRRPRTKEIA